MLDITKLNAQDLVETLKEATRNFDRACEENGFNSLDAVCKAKFLQAVQDELLTRLGWWNNKEV